MIFERVTLRIEFLEFISLDQVIFIWVNEWMKGHPKHGLKISKCPENL